MNDSIAEKLALLKNEIDDVKDAINNNNHEGWAKQEDKLSELSNVVESMYVGHAGFYAMDGSQAAHIEYPIIPDKMFYGWDVLKTVENTQSITSIGVSAFEGSAIDYVPSESTVKEIKDRGFYGCKLDKGAINLNVIETIGPYAFYTGTGSVAFSTGNTLKTIGDSAFENNQFLYSTLSSSLEWIGDNAFKNDTAASFTTLPNSIKHIGDRAFIGTTNCTFNTLPTSLEWLGNNVFEGKQDKANFTSLPPNVIHIGHQPFKTTSSVFTGNLSSTLEYIGAEVFTDNTGRFTGSFPQGLTYVGQKAFYSCGGLTCNGNIFDTTKSYDEKHIVKIGANAFYNCTQLAITGELRRENIPESDIYYPSVYLGDYAFYNCERVGFHGLFPARYLNKPSNVTSEPTIVDYVPQYVFYNCKELRLEQDSLQHIHIGTRAFYNCEYINVTDSIIATGRSGWYGIGQETFKNCKSLVAQDKITSVGAIWLEAFYKCTSLVAKNKISATNYIGEDAFEDCSSLECELIDVSNCDETCIEGFAFNSSFTNNKEFSTLITLSGSNDTTIGDRSFQYSHIAHHGTLTIKWTPKSPAYKLMIQGYSSGCGAFDNTSFRHVVFRGNIPKIGDCTFYENMLYSPVFETECGTTPATESEFNTNKSAYAQLVNGLWYPGTSIDEWSEDTWFPIFNQQGITFDPSTVEIGVGAFLFASELLYFKLPSHIKILRAQCFMSTGIKELIIDAKLEICEKMAFYNNRGLSSLVWNDDIQEIGDYCFACRSDYVGDIPNNLTGEIIMPKNLKYFGDYVFDFTKVNSLVFPVEMVLLEDEIAPPDWDENYFNYYYYDETLDEYKKIPKNSSAVIPAYEPGRYYEALGARHVGIISGGSDDYYLLTDETAPDDWNGSYTKYYYRKEAMIWYEHIPKQETVPPYEPDTYYERRTVCKDLQSVDLPYFTMTEFGGYDRTTCPSGEIHLPVQIKKFQMIRYCPNVTALTIDMPTETDIEMGDGLEEFAVFDNYWYGSQHTRSQYLEHAPLYGNKITEIILPPTVKKIGDGAFCGAGYKSVYPEDLRRYEACSETIKHVVIQSDCIPEPEAIFIQGDALHPPLVTGLFANNIKTTGIELKNVVTIPQYTFYKGGRRWLCMECPDLKFIGNNAFETSMYMTNHPKPAGLTWTRAWGDYYYFWANNKNVFEPYEFPNESREFRIPGSIQRIGEYAFANSSFLHIIFDELEVHEDPNENLQIGANAFSGMSSQAVLHLSWSEGAIDGAPWGFPGTIEYNSSYAGYNWDQWNDPENPPVLPQPPIPEPPGERIYLMRSEDWDWDEWKPKIDPDV